jgi:cell division protein FtsW
MAIGGIFSYSLPLFLEIQKELPTNYFFIRYLIFASLSFLIIIALSKLNPKFFNLIGFSIFIISGVLILLIPFLPSQFAPIIKGAKRWIKLGPIYIAPVEFFKIGLIFFISWSFTRKIQKFHSLKENAKMLLPYLVVFGMIWGVILFGLSDFGQVLVMFLIFLFTLPVAGATRKTILISLAVVFLLLIPAILLKPYRMQRIIDWISNILPNEHLQKPLSNTIQIHESLNAIYHGKISGVGMGDGIFKLGFLSDVHTDFVLAGISEEIGIIGIGIIIFLILALIYNIFLISLKTTKKEYHLFGFGIGTLLMIHFVLNSLGITSIIPLKGLTIPYISYGGSSMIAMSIGIGMVLMISKDKK